MKVVLVDNLDRETINDVLLEENVTEEQAREIADEFNNTHPVDFSYYAMVKPDDYVLWSIIDWLP